MDVIMSLILIYILIAIILAFYLFQSLPLKYKLIFGFGWPVLLIVGFIGYLKIILKEEE